MVDKMIEGFFRLVCCKRSSTGTLVRSGDEDPFARCSSGATSDSAEEAKAAEQIVDVGGMPAHDADASDEGGKSSPRTPSTAQLSFVTFNENQSSTFLRVNSDDAGAIEKSDAKQEVVSTAQPASASQEASFGASHSQRPAAEHQSSASTTRMSGLMDVGTFLSTAAVPQASGKSNPTQRTSLMNVGDFVASAAPPASAAPQASKEVAATKIQAAYRESIARDHLAVALIAEEDPKFLRSGSNHSRSSHRSNQSRRSNTSRASRADDDRTRSIVSILSGASEAQSDRGEGEHDDDSDADAVFELDQLADMLKGNVRKYPKSGNAYGSPHVRYLVVEPAGAKGKRGRYQLGTDWHQELRFWRRGRLAYWPTQKNYEKGDPPSGALEIMKISKVEHKQEVIVAVRHKQGGNAAELILQFDTEEQAKNWRDALHELRGNLQKTVMRV